MERIEVGIKLREARRKKGFTQQMLADAVGISEMYVSQIERGMKMPSLNLFIKIITALDISSDYVLRDELPSGKNFVYQEVEEMLDDLTPKQRRGAIDILDAYIQSIK
jgi:transcriptional regulator with XRE-family HTH domain